MLVAIEGIDGAGKGVQCSFFHSPFKRLSFPSRKYDLIRKYLNKEIEIRPEAIFLLYASDIIDSILSINLKEKWVLDRYVQSTAAYEVSGVGFKRQKEILKMLPYPKADIVFLLDIDPEISVERMSRANKKADRYERIEYLSKVRANYLELAKESFFAKRWVTINAAQSIEKVRDEIRGHMQRLFKDSEG
ncbi:MAG: dTMP kinase [Candidatus Anstonellales archaeon]